MDDKDKDKREKGQKRKHEECRICNGSHTTDECPFQRGISEDTDDDEQETNTSTLVPLVTPIRAYPKPPVSVFNLKRKILKTSDTQASTSTASAIPVIISPREDNPIGVSSSSLTESNASESVLRRIRCVDLEEASIPTPYEQSSSASTSNSNGQQSSKSKTFQQDNNSFSLSTKRGKNKESKATTSSNQQSTARKSKKDIVCKFCNKHGHSTRRSKHCGAHEQLSDVKSRSKAREKKKKIDPIKIINVGKTNKPKKQQTDKQVASNKLKTDRKLQRDYYTIVTGLEGFIIDSNIDGISSKQVLLDEFKSASKEISSLMVEFSLYVNFLFQRKIETEAVEVYQAYFDNLNANNSCLQALRHMALALAQNLSQEYPLEEEYSFIRERLLEKKTYDLANRASYLTEEMADYRKNMIIHIHRMMPKVLERFYTMIPDDDGAVMTDLEALMYIDNLLTIGARDDRLDVSFHDWENRPFSYIPLFVRLKNIFSTSLDSDGNQIKTFGIVPMCKAKSRHITITSKAGIRDLLRRTFGNRHASQDILTNTRQYWERYFDVTRFESKTKFVNREPLKKFHYITSNGIAVSVLMTRVKPEYQRSWEKFNQQQLTSEDNQHHTVGDDIVDEEDEEISWQLFLDQQQQIISEDQQPIEEQRHSLGNNEQREIPEPYATFNYVSGIDPGRRLTLGGVIITSSTYPHLEYNVIKYSSKQYYHKQGRNYRRLKLERITNPLESEIHREREALSNIGVGHFDYVAFTKFELRFFERRMELYTDEQITRMEFDSYIKRDKAIDDMVKRFCPSKSRTLVFMGDALESANSPIRGYLKSPHRRICHAMMNLDRVEVQFVDEYRTTRCCSNCYEISPPTKLPGHRYIFCRNCKKSFNRDVNAGDNMVTKGLHKCYGRYLPENLRRTINNQHPPNLNYFTIEEHARAVYNTPRESNGRIEEEELPLDVIAQIEQIERDEMQRQAPIVDVEALINFEDRDEIFFSDYENDGVIISSDEDEVLTEFY